MTFKFWFSRMLKNPLWAVLACLFPFFLTGMYSFHGLFNPEVSANSAALSAFSENLTYAFLDSFFYTYLFALFFSLIYAAVKSLMNKEPVPAKKWGRVKKGITAGVLICAVLAGASVGWYALNQPAYVEEETPFSPEGEWYGRVNAAEYHFVIDSEGRIFSETLYASPVSLKDADMEYEFLKGPMYGAENGGYLVRSSTNRYDVYFLYVLPYCDYYAGYGITSADDLVFEYLEPYLAGQILMTGENRMLVQFGGGGSLILTRIGE